MCEISCDRRHRVIPFKNHMVFQLLCMSFGLRAELIVYNIVKRKEANNYDIVVVSYFITTFGDNS